MRFKNFLCPWACHGSGARSVMPSAVRSSSVVADSMVSGSVRAEAAWGRRRLLRAPAVVLALILWSVPLQANEPPTRVGSEFQINTAPQDYYQDSPAVAMDDSGEFIVVWRSEVSSGTDGSLNSVQGRRYAADGSASGGIFQVNTYTSGNQDDPSVTIGASGEAFIAWRSVGSAGSDTSGSSVQGQRIDAAGQVVGGEFQINSDTAGEQVQPMVATTQDGQVLAVWTSAESAGDDTLGTSIQGQRYDSVGVPSGGPFQVNGYTTGDQSRPALAPTPDGGFVLVWESAGSPGSDDQFSSVQGRIFDSAGQPSGAQFQVNSYTTNAQETPVVSVVDDGTFLVVWVSGGSADTNLPSIQGQLYDAGGTPLGGQLAISNDPGLSQGEPASAPGPKGRHVVVWAGGVFSVSKSAISGQVVSPDGTLLNDSFQVDSSGIYKTQPSVASGRQGEFVVAWHNLVYPQGGGYNLVNSVRGQRYEFFLFADGFESGDTTNWSQTSP